MSSSEETGPASTPASPPAQAPASGPRPPRVTALAALCGLEALTLLGAGGYLLVMGLLGRPDSPRQAETGGLTVIALALLPLLAVRGLLLRRSWSRGPALIIQIMALPVAWTLLQASGIWIPAGIALAAVAVTGLVLLLHPTTTEALGIGPGARDSTGD
ncbi:hypothetical protein ACIO1C_24155 [Streptomyces sp. NPDC087420]|uniref:hypothetical protein n=1 Tax=Streptomyces sp. NPDC087420 TaxID=3365785 RepID=UPI003833A848